MRIITSLNWVLGVFALVLAFAGPTLVGLLRVSPNQTIVEGTTGKLLQSESVYAPLNKGFLEFEATRTANIEAFNELNLGEPESKDGQPIFLYSARRDGAGGIVVTASTNPELVRRAGYRPMVYTRKMTHAGEEEGSWVPLSGKKRGLLGIF